MWGRDSVHGVGSGNRQTRAQAPAPPRPTWVAAVGDSPPRRLLPHLQEAAKIVSSSRILKGLRPITREVSVGHPPRARLRAHRPAGEKVGEQENRQMRKTSRDKRREGGGGRRARRQGGQASWFGGQGRPRAEGSAGAHWAQEGWAEVGLPQYRAVHPCREVRAIPAPPPTQRAPRRAMSPTPACDLATPRVRAQTPNPKPHPASGPGHRIFLSFFFK